VVNHSSKVFPPHVIQLENHSLDHVYSVTSRHLYTSLDCVQYSGMHEDRKTKDTFAVPFNSLGNAMHTIFHHFRLNPLH
jgi:hypothetical protein